MRRVSVWKEGFTAQSTSLLAEPAVPRLPAWRDKGLSRGNKGLPACAPAGAPACAPVWASGCVISRPCSLKQGRRREARRTARGATDHRARRKVPGPREAVWRGRDRESMASQRRAKGCLPERGRLAPSLGTPGPPPPGPAQGCGPRRMTAIVARRATAPLSRLSRQCRPFRHFRPHGSLSSYLNGRENADCGAGRASAASASTSSLPARKGTPTAGTLHAHPHPAPRYLNKMAADSRPRLPDFEVLYYPFEITVAWRSFDSQIVRITCLSRNTFSHEKP